MQQILRFPTILLVVFSLLLGWGVAELKNADYTGAVMDVIKEEPEQPKEPVVRTKEEWQQQLTSVEYEVLREAGTEPSNGAIYKQFKKQGKGTYYCVGCNAELFTSEAKFDSRSGWPSFYDVAVKENIKLDVDYKIGYKRVEILCGKCDGHLGHVFEGEGFDTPTDKRYCVNGVCLKFLPEGEKEKSDPTPEKGAEEK